jgi:hypothetical protein
MCLSWNCANFEHSTVWIGEQLAFPLKPLACRSVIAFSRQFTRQQLQPSDGSE